MKKGNGKDQGRREKRRKGDQGVRGGINCMVEVLGEKGMSVRLVQEVCSRFTGQRNATGSAGEERRGSSRDAI